MGKRYRTLTFVVSGDADVSYKDRILRGINWKFNAWGGEYDGLYADWSRDDKIAIEFMKHFGCDYYNAAPFVLEGGLYTQMEKEHFLLQKIVF